MPEYEIRSAWIDSHVGRIDGGSIEMMKEIVARGL